MRQPLCLILLAGCATASVSGPKVELAPRPFTLEQIRGATRAGRTYRFRMESPEGTSYRRIRFTAVDDEGWTTESAITDAAGAPQGEPKVSRGSWEELLGHASYPRAITEIEEAIVEVPAGRFDGLRYTTRERNQGAEVVSVSHFANALPGAPVRLEVRRDDKLVTTMILIEYHPGD